MTPALRTAILDALMERWRQRWEQASSTTLAYKRKHLSSCLDMILPIAEPMIREAALRDVDEMLKPKGERPKFSPAVYDAQNVARYDQASEDAAAVRAILALGEPK